MSNDFRIGDQAHERVKLHIPKSDSNLGVLIGGFVAALLCLFIAVKCDDDLDCRRAPRSGQKILPPLY